MNHIIQALSLVSLSLFPIVNGQYIETALPPIQEPNAMVPTISTMAATITQSPSYEYSVQNDTSTQYFQRNFNSKFPKVNHERKILSIIILCLFVIFALYVVNSIWYQLKQQNQRPSQFPL
eukprot:798486_1